MTYDVEYLYECLFGICIESLYEVSVQVLRLVFNQVCLFVFLLMSLQISWYILANSPLSDVPFANIFS